MTDIVEEQFETAEQLGEWVARRVIDGIVASGADGRRYLLGCPGGRTPKPIFRALGRRCAEQQIDCSNVVIVMMDDYLQPDAESPTLVPADAHYSCRRFAEHDIRRVINEGLGAELVITPESVWFPDPAEPSAYDTRLADAGGIDLFIVASGASDGHVAFCGPGADRSGVTAIVPLARSTQQDNMATFPGFRSIDDVPTRGISVGLGTIGRLSREILLILHGPDKHESWRRVRGGSEFTADWPATFVHDCDNVTILTDALARGES